ncbi:MAG: PEP-CTERM sorting domain-containing protein [Planctomycetaceae bacterium]|nr:PEP-CTERM sorting domain-containing protein [Planctomycetaceae bacterium]
MRKVVVALSFLVILTGAYARAAADTFYIDISTDGVAELWKAAYIQVPDYVNPTKGSADSKGRGSYALEGTQWDYGFLSFLDPNDFDDVSQPGAAKENGWNQATGWVYPVADTRESGFYAYMFEISMEEFFTPEVEKLVGNLVFSTKADDHVTAIYVNGAPLYLSNISMGDDFGNYALMTLFEREGIEVTIPAFELIIVVQNTGNQTPTGLYVTGDFGFEQIRDKETMPEPATLLILGLGAVGAGFVARRRK